MSTSPRADNMITEEDFIKRYLEKSGYREPEFDATMSAIETYALINRLGFKIVEETS